MAGFEYQGFRMFRFNPDRLKELVPEQFKTISAKLPPQDDMIKDIIYQERRSLENCSGQSRNISCFEQGTGRIF